MGGRQGGQGSQGARLHHPKRRLGGHHRGQAERHRRRQSRHLWPAGQDGRWGVAHSLRAQENDDAEEYDTVIPDCDYRELNSYDQKLFVACSELFDGHRFYKSHNLTRNKVRDARVRGASSGNVTSTKPVISPYCDFGQ